MNLNLKVMKKHDYTGIKSRYALVERLGQGGQGNVFKCKDLNNDFFAIKIFSMFFIKNKQIQELTEENENRFINECQALYRYNHKNIIKALDYGDFLFYNKRIKFFVMELAKEKCTIESYVRINDFQNNPPEMWRIIKDILAGLIYVYEEDDGTFHRDLKPANILVKKDGTIAITDFGLAHFREYLKKKPVDSIENVKMHNYRYYAPEQKRIARGEENINVDHRCDIFAIGQIIHELITGDIIHSTGNIDVGLINDRYGGKLNKILRKMTHYNINLRYSSYSDIQRDFKEYFSMRGEDSIKIDNLTKNISKNLSSLDKNKGISLRLAINDYYNHDYDFQKKDIAQKLYDVISWYLKLEEYWFKNLEVVPEPSREILEPILTRVNKCMNYFKQIVTDNISLQADKFEEEIQDFLECFDQLSTPNSDQLGNLDSLISKDDINEEDISELEILLTKPTNSNYFFMRLTSELWFNKLKSQNFLKKPTIYEVKGNLDIHFWPQIHYLRNISTVLPEDVLALITNYGASQNYILNRGYLDCILRMPTSITKISIDFIREIFTYYFSIIEIDLLIQIITKAIGENEKAYAYQLFEILFNLKKPSLDLELKTNREPVYRSYYYLFSRKREFLDNFIEFDNATKDRKYLGILINSLSQILKVKFLIEGDINEDYPYTLRTSLIEREFLYDYDVPNQLINEIIYYLDSSNSDYRKQDYNKLLQQHWVIFIRIAITLLIKYPIEFQEEIKNVLTNDNYFLKDSLKNEIHPLLQNNYGNLNDTDIKLVNTLILHGPSEQLYFYRREDFSTEMKFTTWKEEYKRLWILNKLKFIDQQIIHPELKDYYLKNQHIEKIPGSLRTTYQETSYQNNLILGLSTEDLIDYLSRETLFKENLTSDLKKRIKNDPINDEKLFLNLNDIPRFYYNPIYAGLREHFFYNEPTDYLIFITLINPVFTILSNEPILLTEEDLWFTINQILRKILESEKESLTEEKLDTIHNNLKILLNLLQSESEIVEYKEDYVQALSFAWSSLLGQTSWTYFEFIIKKWFYLPDNEELKQFIMREIQFYFKKFSNSLIFNSIIASYFTFICKIDGSWAKDLSIKIFNVANPIMYRASWESYFLSSYLRNHNVYLILKDCYEELITHIKELNIHYEVLNTFTMHILHEHIVYADKLIYKFIELNDSELISNMMRLTLHVNKSKHQNLNEINSLTEFWELILNNEKIEMLSFERKNKIYSWYTSFFEDLEPAERHLLNLSKMLERTKGRIRGTHSVFRHLFDYIGIKDSVILDIIIQILGSSANNDIYFHSFRIIKDLMHEIEIKDLIKLKQIIEYSTKRGDFSIREDFENRFEESQN